MAACGRVRRVRCCGPRGISCCDGRFGRPGDHAVLPSAGLADRILAEIEAPRKTGWPVYGVVQPRPIWPIITAIAAAAVVLAIALPTLNRSLERVQRNGPTVTLHIIPRLIPLKRGSALTDHR